MEEYLGFLFVIIILGIITGIMGEWIAKKKGRREREGFWLGFLLSFIGLIIECVLPKLSKPDPVTQSSGIDGRVFDASASDGRSRRKCPFCAEMILAEARVCRYCQRDVPPSTNEQQSPAQEQSSLFASSSSELNSRKTEPLAQSPPQLEQVAQAPAQSEPLAQSPPQLEQVVQAPAPLTCPSCARRISANDTFCFFCGKKLGV
jgi:uncharacterized membrane protein YeaQ/YmgE (transglycosylase-associated protein family)